MTSSQNNWGGRSSRVDYKECASIIKEDGSWRLDIVRERMGLDLFLKSPYLIAGGYPLGFLHSIDIHCITGTMLDAGDTKTNKIK